MLAKVIKRAVSNMLAARQELARLADRRTELTLAYLQKQWRQQKETQASREAGGVSASELSPNENLTLQFLEYQTEVLSLQSQHDLSRYKRDKLRKKKTAHGLRHPAGRLLLS